MGEDAPLFSDFGPQGPADALVPLTPSELYPRPRGGNAAWRLLLLGAKMRSEDVLEHLARYATDRTRTWSEVKEALGAGAEPPASWKREHLVAAGLLQCVLEPANEHFDLSRRILQSTLPSVDLGVPAARQALLLAVQVAAITRSRELLEGLRRWQDLQADAFWAAEADLLLEEAAADLVGDTARETEAVGRWWRFANAPVTESGLEPFELRCEGAAPSVFDRVRAPDAEADPESERGPLVTVLVPVFNPEEVLLAVVESLTKQSWRNIEVVLIDDCSERGADLLARAAASDPRVRLIRNERNEGAYRAFNAGLSVARGDFITFQGADDVSHPRRIERQLRPLLGDEGIVATTSGSQRINGDGSHTYFGSQPHRVNVSSLLFRREPVLDALGRFDDVRKGADSEFVERLERVFGEHAIAHVDEVMSLVQLTQGSLSRADFRFGWRSAAREHYVTQYRGRHRRAAAQGFRDLRYSAETPRSGWVPPRFAGIAEPVEVGTALLSDWYAPIEQNQDAAALLSALLTCGPAPVGLLQGELGHVRAGSRRRVRSRVREAVESGTATWIGWEEEVEAGTLIIGDPAYLALLPRRQEMRFRAGRVLILADGAARGFRGPHPRFAPVEWCEARVREYFGVAPEWVTASPRVAEHVSARGGIVRTGSLRRLRCAESAAASGTGRPGVPVIGVPTPMRGEGIRWSAEALGDFFPGPDVSVLCYDEHGYIESPDELPPGWDLLRGDEADRAGFLDRVDLIAPDPLLDRPVGAAAWVHEALERGVAPVLPRDYAWDLGDLVTTHLPGGGRDLLVLMAYDEELRAERSSRALESARSIPGLPAALGDGPPAKG